MLFYKMSRPLASAIRLAGLGLIIWSIVASQHPPGDSGRGLVVLVALVVASVSFVAWVLQPNVERGVSLELYLMSRARGMPMESPAVRP